ncbi:MAG: S41 family peptidase [Oscillospiraceae bacterium]|nr:S41 family peptidase [Oscillospiraceae bacterium]
MKKKILTILSYILVAAAASFWTLLLTAPEEPEYSKLAQLEEIIQEKYIDPVDEEAIEDAAATAMVEALGDRWSYYIPASEYQAYLEQMENAYVGIGITIVVAEDGTGVEVMVVDENGPADQAGMQVGDVIVAVDGTRIGGMDTVDIRNMVRGTENTQVEITVRRDGEELTMPITRAYVQVPVATGEMLENGIGLVTINNFDTRCTDETLAAIEALLDQGAEKLIFDVRNNPGGYAKELVQVLDYLLPEGELFRTVNYTGAEAVDKSDARCLELPMAVLVNADSYSAAEFFAAALQEYEAAVIIGEQTSGKGYFQNTYTLDDWSAVGLSIGKYFTPKGVSLEGVGITPDIPVEVDDETYMAIYYGTLEPENDPQLQAAIEALQ